jgi:Protein of unknown function (DUF1634)
MTPTDLARHQRLEAVLARLLDRGTWIGCLVIGIGLLVVLFGSARVPETGLHIVAAGVAVFIALPILRVALMTIMFLAERDYAFAAIAASVLLIVALGAVAGLEYPNVTF